MKKTVHRSVIPLLLGSILIFCGVQVPPVQADGCSSLGSFYTQSPSSVAGMVTCTGPNGSTVLQPATVAAPPTIDTSPANSTIVPSSVPAAATVPGSGAAGSSGGSGGSGTQSSAYDGQGNITNYVPLEPLPGLAQFETGNSSFGQLLTGLFKILITIGALITVGTFVYAGVVYMTSEVVGNKKNALSRIQASLLGLFVLIASWLILSTINTQLVTFGSGSLNLNPAQNLSPVVAPVTTPPAATPLGPVPEDFYSIPPLL